MNRFNRSVLLCTIIFSRCLAAEVPPVPQTIINNYNGQITANVAISGLPIKEMFKMLSKCMDDVKELANQRYNKATHWLKTNRLAFAAAGLGGLYVFIANKVMHGKAVLYTKTNWSSWKEDASLADLLNLPTNKLCRELHQSILDKYNNNNRSDAIVPLMLFGNDLDQEMQTLKTFSYLCEKLGKAHVQKLFLIAHHEPALVKEKINRLVLLKKIITESIHVSLNT